MSLALRAFQKLSFEEMLPYFYPEWMLTSTYEDYDKEIRKEEGRYPDAKPYWREFYPSPHVVPYKDEVLTREFISRVYDGEVAMDFLIGALDLILRAILSEGRLMMYEDASTFLWTRKGDKYLVFSLDSEQYSPVNRLVFSTLEKVLDFILSEKGVLMSFSDVPPETLDSTTKGILTCMKDLHHEDVMDFKREIQERVYYEFILPAKYFSFYPFTAIKEGYNILTDKGFFVMGLDADEVDEDYPKVAAFSPEDVDLVLTSANFNDEQLGETEEIPEEEEEEGEE